MMGFSSTKIDHSLMCSCGQLARVDAFAGEYDEQGYHCTKCVRQLNTLSMEQARSLGGLKMEGTLTVGTHVPELKPKMQEIEKYTKMWDRPEYRITAPGTIYVDEFVHLARPVTGDTIVDFGCGTGRAGLELSKHADTLMLDFAPNALDQHVREALGDSLRFVQHDLMKPWDGLAGIYGFCTDVMEHIPPQDVDTVLTNILSAAIKVYFNISTMHDHWGIVVGEPLHMTVQPPDWWKAKLESLGFRIDFSREEEESVVFWGSIYANGNDVNEKTGLNVSENRVRSNMLANMALGLNDVCPHAVQDETIYVLAGGPSLLEFEDEVVELGCAGAKIVTVNGTYKWLLDRGIKPAAHFMVDAREFNERFIHKIVGTCKYIFSSQCAHEAVVKVPPEQAWIYHSGDSVMVREIFEERCKAIGVDLGWYPIQGGSTVVSRALVVLAMLGFRKIVVFGWDSCLMGDKHHAYEQKENDEKYAMDVFLGGRQFRCHPWMVVQANEFSKLVRYIFGPIEGFELDVRGDGLLAHILKYASQLAAKGD